MLMSVGGGTFEILRAVSQGEPWVKTSLRGNRAEMTVEGEIDKEICILNASLCACRL